MFFYESHYGSTWKLFSNKSFCIKTWSQQSTAINFLLRETFSSTRLTFFALRLQYKFTYKFTVWVTLFLPPVVVIFQYVFFMDDGCFSKCWACNVIQVGAKWSNTAKNIICNKRCLLPDKFIHSLLKNLKIVKDCFKLSCRQSVSSQISFLLVEILFFNILSTQIIGTHLITSHFNISLFPSAPAYHLDKRANHFCRFLLSWFVAKTFIVQLLSSLLSSPFSTAKKETS